MHGMYLFHAIPFAERPEGSEKDPQSFSVEYKYGYLYINGDPCGGRAALWLTREAHTKNECIRQNSFFIIHHYFAQF